MPSTTAQSPTVTTRLQIRALLPLIGWSKLHCSAPEFAMPDRMELDLEGLGKEFAVDCTMLKRCALTDTSTLVNFGGDLRDLGPHLDARGA